MKYLLDSNVCIHYMRPKGNPTVKKRILTQSFADLAISAVTLMELEFGALISPQPIPELAKVAQLKSQILVLPFLDTCAEHAGRVRAQLQFLGTPIGPYDLMIAATALANGLTLVTHNLREFSRASGLSLEDWEIP